MMNLGRCLPLASLICCYCAITASPLWAQNQSALPDSPGYTLMAKSVEARPPAPSEPLISDDPGSSASAHNPAQTERPAVDNSTGVPQRVATWRSLPGDFLHDQKDLWTFPLQVMKGKHLVPVAVVLGGTVGLIYADPHTMPYFVKNQHKWDKVNDVFDPLITTGEVISLPAGLMTAGYIRHDDREVNTALLAVEAYGDSVIINLAMKAITRRQRPSDVGPNGDFSDTFFNGGKSPLKGSSFPSGHSTAVWSVATIVAERYRHRGKPWIPILSYTLATAISLSRISTAAHFPSDVWLGASLGHSIAKYQTLSPRR